ncbi:hypothetical protein BDN67DRAFT_983855 [Paxillus ammoniavirescens]|nr:hypothetical protein BDN67DRAFT_983855 [Paxillus ammoniavirescens]
MTGQMACPPCLHPLHPQDPSPAPQTHQMPCIDTRRQQPGMHYKRSHPSSVNAQHQHMEDEEPREGKVLTAGYAPMSAQRDEEKRGREGKMKEDEMSKAEHKGQGRIDERQKKNNIARSPPPPTSIIHAQATPSPHPSQVWVMTSYVAGFMLGYVTASLVFWNTLWANGLTWSNWLISLKCPKCLKSDIPDTLGDQEYIEAFIHQSTFRPEKCSAQLRSSPSIANANSNVPQSKDDTVELDDNHKNEDNNPEAEYQEIQEEQ